MRPRFYAPALDARLGRVTLPAGEARHLTRVLRLRAGDEVAVFDGRGAEFRAVVESAAHDAASLRLVEPLQPAHPPRVQVHIVQAVLKPDAMDAAVRDATMMGAASIQPVLTEHADVKAALVRRAAVLERWRRIALAAAKQSRRSTLPAVAEVLTFAEGVAAAAQDVRLLFVEPSAPCGPRTLRSLVAEPVPASAAVLLGPEGGWAAAEIELAQRNGFAPVTLGPLTLRAESMAVASLAALAAMWEGC